MVSDNPETFADLDGHLSPDSGPYNLETGDSSAGQDGQGHRCDYVGGDCSQKQKNAQKNVNGDDKDQAQQQNVTITYDKGVPAMTPATAKYVRGVLNAASIKSAKISATTNGKHATHSWHYKGKAVDIHVVNGTRVIFYKSNPAERAAVNAIQGAANGKRNGVAHENYGPAGLYKDGRQINNPGLQRQHENHIHLTIPDPWEN